MSDSRAIDQESRRLIRQELQTNILVEAGAGSGKTQMLAERMAAGVAAGVYPIEQMAAVTFTRKAASELRGRFHLALEASCPTSQQTRSGSLASNQRFRTSSAFSLELFTHSVRVCCVSGPSSPECRQVSPNWTRFKTWNFASECGEILLPALGLAAIQT